MCNRQEDDPEEDSNALMKNSQRNWDMIYKRENTNEVLQ